MDEIMDWKTLRAAAQYGTPIDCGNVRHVPVLVLELMCHKATAFGLELYVENGRLNASVDWSRLEIN